MRREPSFEPDESAAEEPAPRLLVRAKPFRRLRRAGQLASAAALIAGLALVARDRGPAPPAPAPWSDPPRALAPVRAATPVAAGGPLLGLEPAQPDLPLRTEPPRWNAATGLREDALTSGSFDAIEAPYLVLTMTDGAETGSSLFVTLARRAADGRGLAVTRTGERGQLATKFGAFETVAATLSGEGSRACLGFQSLETQAMRLDGWLCGILGQMPEPRDLACAVDRLVLKGTSVSPLETAFTQAEARRDPSCKAGTGAEAAQAGEATGSITPAKAGKPTAHSAAQKRARKNEALLRQNAQASR
ncbi:hypothetical protein [Methylobacterium organophilum]|uniref:Transmembrane protein n=1 Tax=Methylobacterium organophilum TaxID=410 RepID=A0ABQ4T3D8_METOR|nr:hypothetical protein [Methylobacterium organophilum]GJE26157.1 hypothetical protein LKMONMHP_1004 [Methylobacterium organophilum]